MAFSGVRSDGGRPSFGSNKVVILKSILIGDPGTRDGSYNWIYLLGYFVEGG